MTLAITLSIISLIIAIGVAIGFITFIININRYITSMEDDMRALTEKNYELEDFIKQIAKNSGVPTEEGSIGLEDEDIDSHGGD